jgi:hypothetical protein
MTQPQTSGPMTRAPPPDLPPHSYSRFPSDSHKCSVA